MKSSLLYILYIYVRFKKKDGIMGRVTSHEFDRYGKGKEQIDVAAQNPSYNPEGNQSAGILCALRLPELISGAVSIAEANSKTNKATETSTGSSNPKEETTTPESLEKEINDKFAAIGMPDKTLSDLDNEISSLDSEANPLTQAVTTAKSTLDNLTTEFNTNVTQLTDLKAAYDQAVAKPESERTSEEQTLIKTYRDLQARNKQIEDTDKPNATKALENAEKAKNDRKLELQEARKYIEYRVTLLDKLTGKDALNKYKDPETAAVLEAQKGVNGADNTNQSEKVSAYIKSVRAYCEKNPEGVKGNKLEEYKLTKEIRKVLKENKNISDEDLVAKVGKFAIKQSHGI